MPQLETYYDVSDWTIRQWIEQGMPVEPMAPSRPADPHDSPRQTKNHRRFDLAKVQAWHAERSELAETA
jgi:phage terminase Nu1 subunit (DNA packaging protein)